MFAAASLRHHFVAIGLGGPQSWNKYMGRTVKKSPYCIPGNGFLQRTTFPIWLRYDEWMTPLTTCDTARPRPSRFLFFISWIGWWTGCSQRPLCTKCPLTWLDHTLGCPPQSPELESTLGLSQPWNVEETVLSHASWKWTTEKTFPDQLSHCHLLPFPPSHPDLSSLACSY